MGTPVSNLKASGNGSIGALLTSLNFPANAAATFTYNNPIAGTRTFLALNNGTADFSASPEAILEITGDCGNLSRLQMF
ncbi:MAG: bluetail domain-containing putative surface protein [Prochlorococcaceae cyanobacterium]